MEQRETRRQKSRPADRHLLWRGGWGHRWRHRRLRRGERRVTGRSRSGGSGAGNRRGGGDLKRRLWRLEGSRCQRMAIAVRIAPLVLDVGSGCSGQVHIHQRFERTRILQLRIARHRWRRGGRWRRRIGPAFTNLAEKIKPLRFGVHQRPVRVLWSCTLVPPWWDKPPVAGQLGASPSAARNPNWRWCNDGDRHKITTQTCLSNSQ